MGEENPKYFDPLADKKERSRLRYEYRELISTTRKNKEELIKPESTGLHKALDQGEELFSRVKNSREAALDSKFLGLSSSFNTEQVKHLKVHLVTFEKDVFAAKLITFMGGRAALGSCTYNEDDDGKSASRPTGPHLNWSKLGKKVTPYNLKRTPTVDFMYGPLTMVPPTKRQRIAHTQDKPDPSQKVVPLELVKVKETDHTIAERERILKCLLKASTDENGEVYPVCYFKFVINPSSYGQTVENIFHLSFLVQKGRVKIDLDEDTRLPLVAPATPYQEEQGCQIVRLKALVMMLTQGDYKELMQVFDVKEPMIPTRTSSVPS